MRAVWTLALKDLRLLSRDWMGMFFIIAFPVIMGVMFGIIGGSFGSGAKANSLTIAIVDQDNTDGSHQFVEYLNEQTAITTTPRARDDAAALVRKRGAVAFLVIPEGFGATAGIPWREGPALQLGVDPSRAAEAGMIQGMIMQASGRMLQDTFSNPAAMRRQLDDSISEIESTEELSATQRTSLGGLFGTLDTFLGSLEEFNTSAEGEGLGGGPQMELARIEMVDVVAEKSRYAEVGAKLRSKWDISFPAAIMWGVMGCVAGFAVSIAQERTAGTFFRLQTAPISRTHVLAGKALACFLAVIGVVIFMMALGLALGIQLARPMLLLPATLCIAIAFVGLMMLIAVVGKTEQAVGGAGWAIIVVMCMFGGGMMPLAFMPPVFQTISHFSPVKWGIYALEGAVWRGLTLPEMLLPCGILLGIGAVGFALGARILSKAES